MNVLKIGCLVIFMVMAIITNAQEIIAHRGASFLAPENTMASVKLGFELGADAVEIDVFLSKDNRLMVIHDEDTRRTAKGKNLIIKETDSKDLRRLDVGSWKDSKYKGEKIPFLEDILSLVPEDKKLVIEFKTEPEILPHFAVLMKEYPFQSNLIIISFNKETIIESKKDFPEIPAYWLMHNYNEHSIDDAIKIALDNRLNGLNLHYKLIDQELVQKVHAANLELLTYTVNDIEIASQLKSLKVNGITTDRPGWLRQQLELSSH